MSPHLPGPAHANPSVLASTDVTGVILGLVPRIQRAAGAGAGGEVDGRDKPDHDNRGPNRWSLGEPLAKHNISVVVQKHAGGDSRAQLGLAVALWDRANWVTTLKCFGVAA